MATPDVEYRIAERAQQIWEQEGRPEGRQVEHWLQAEREILDGAEGRKKADKKTALGNEKPASDGKAAKAGKSAEPDDLTRIKGIGKKVARKLNDLGIKTFAQIAGWKRKEIGAIDKKLAFEGRIKRQEWVKQAKKLDKR